MFRFLRITLILWLLSVALVGGAALYGRTHAAPNELQALGFDVCEGRPCFMGITPGVTKWKDAIQIAEEHGAKSVDKQSWRLTDFAQMFLVYPESLAEADPAVWIRAMDSSSVPLPISTGDALQLWGTPCGFSPDTQDSKYLILNYPAISLVISQDYQFINPDTSIHQIIISSKLGDCNGWKSWPGFTTPERYWKLYANQSD